MNQQVEILLATLKLNVSVEVLKTIVDTTGDSLNSEDLITIYNDYYQSKDEVCPFCRSDVSQLQFNETSKGYWSEAIDGVNICTGCKEEVDFFEKPTLQEWLLMTA
ncbi:hypothetical protein ACR777_10580 [Sphingobacterium spiritivorum]|uniref:hypothetical protein n=1 Tax=Sphingobacterium spiritivorum TaxID=258 RepID=UPI003DA35397